MSPTEAELRAFLHDGEGDVPDATSAISRALRVRYERKRRINTIVSSAAVVAVVATGLTFLFTRSDNEQAGSAATNAGGAGPALSMPHAGAALSGQARPHPSTPSSQKHALSSGRGSGGGSSGFRADSRSAEAAVSGVACPSTPTSYALPGGGGLNTYGADEPMFARRPAGMKVCGYSLVSQGRPKATVLSATATRTVARLIEKSSPLPGPSRMCPDRPVDANRRIEIIAADAAGRRLRAVTITFQTCGPTKVTNGTSVRYLYRLPASLRKLVGPDLPAR